MMIRNIFQELLVKGVIENLLFTKNNFTVLKNKIVIKVANR